MIRPDELRAARQQHGYTQLQTAVELGVSYQTYRLWEAGGMRPSAENEVRVRDLLKIEGESGHDSDRGTSAR